MKKVRKNGDEVDLNAQVVAGNRANGQMRCSSFKRWIEGNVENEWKKDSEGKLPLGPSCADH
jgi:hypothetical protein